MLWQNAPAAPHDTEPKPHCDSVPSALRENEPTAQRDMVPVV